MKYRYKHTVSLTFTGGTPQGHLDDPADIVDTLKSCDVEGLLPEFKDSNNYQCVLKGETTLLISSIHLSPAGSGVFVLRLGGEYNKRPHDVMLKISPALNDVHLLEALPLPPRMGFYMTIPDNTSITLVGRATSDVPPPTVSRRKQDSEDYDPVHEQQLDLEAHVLDLEVPDDEGHDCYDPRDGQRYWCCVCCGMICNIDDIHSAGECNFCHAMNKDD